MSGNTFNTIKYHKLKNSTDQAIYPIYSAVVEIEQKIGDSISQLTSILISAILGIVYDKSFISSWVFFKIKKIEPTDQQTIITSAILTGLTFLFLRFAIPFFKNIFYSNKNNEEKRTELTNYFYHVLIPQLIEAVSLYEQYDESSSQSNTPQQSNTSPQTNVSTEKYSFKKEGPRHLILLEAYNTVQNLFDEIHKIGLVDTKHQEAAEDLRNQIGLNTINTVYIELLKLAGSICHEFEVNYASSSEEEIKNLKLSLEYAGLDSIGYIKAEREAITSGRQ